MTQSTPRQLLEAQHHEIDELAGAVREGQGGAETLDRMLALLWLHLYIEEEILFPAVATPALQMPLYILEYEHGQIVQFMDSLAQAREGKQTLTDAMSDDCRRLLKLFKIHNPKEEDLVYASADTAAESDPHNQLVTSIQAAELPQDWQCKANREDFAPPPGAPPWEPPKLPR